VLSGKVRLKEPTTEWGITSGAGSASIKRIRMMETTIGLKLTSKRLHGDDVFASRTRKDY
jgi:hypothetical protein